MYDEGAVKTVLAEADCDVFIENPGSGMANTDAYYSQQGSVHTPVSLR